MSRVDTGYLKARSLLALDLRVGVATTLRADHTGIRQHDVVRSLGLKVCCLACLEKGQVPLERVCERSFQNGATYASWCAATQIGNSS